MRNEKISFAVGILLSTFIGLNSACQPSATNTNTAQTSPAPTAAATSQTATVADGDWPGYNRTLDSQRYSPLNQITPENVGSMKQICTFDLGENGNFQSGIVVANNTMYVTTDTNTFAIDPATCQQKWKHHYEKPTPEGLRVNRGVAYSDGKVFRGINTGNLMALEANTGQLLWESKMADSAKGESIPAAPIVRI